MLKKRHFYRKLKDNEVKTYTDLIAGTMFTQAASFLSTIPLGDN